MWWGQTSRTKEKKKLVMEIKEVIRRLGNFFWCCVSLGKLRLFANHLKLLFLVGGMSEGKVERVKIDWGSLGGWLGEGEDWLKVREFGGALTEDLKVFAFLEVGS
jgi:hypothetical protein